jgi:prepilin signal peptidase PulO-like enzyme (type II secretory pathway)
MTEIVSAPAPDSPATPPAVSRPPTRELLPSGVFAVAVAVAGAALLVTSLVDFGLSGRGLVGAILCPVLVVLAAIDFKHRLLPNDIVLPTALVIGLVVVVSNPGDFPKHLLAGAALGLFFFAFALIFTGSLGLGDAKLGFLLGLALGSRTLTAVMVALFGLLLAALWILATEGLSARKKAIPFGPFLALGGILAFFFG